MQELEEAFVGRLTNLSAVYRHLSESNWRSAKVHDLVRAALEPYCSPSYEDCDLKGSVHQQAGYISARPTSHRRKPLATHGRSIHLGHEHTSRRVRVMSLLPLKADIRQRFEHVRFVPKADLRSRGDNLPLAAWCALD